MHILWSVDRSDFKNIVIECNLCFSRIVQYHNSCLVMGFLFGRSFAACTLGFCRQWSFPVSCHYCSRKLPTFSSVYSKQKQTVFQNTFFMQGKTRWLAFATVNVKAFNYCWVIVSSKTYLFVWKCSRFCLENLFQLLFPNLFRPPVYP